MMRCSIDNLNVRGIFRLQHSAVQRIDINKTTRNMRLEEVFFNSLLKTKKHTDAKCESCV